MPHTEEDSSPFDQVLCSRRTIHEYSTEPVPEPVLMRALEAACAAPNHRMTEPWRFVIVGPKSRQALFELSLELKSQKGPLSEEAREKLRSKMLSSYFLLAVSRVRHARADVEREDYAAIACAIQNLMLSLWNQGFGSKWSTGAVTCHERTYGILDVDPSLQELVGFVWVGVPKLEGVKPARRHSLEQVVSRVP